MNRKRTYVDAKRRIKKHLAPFFGNRRMIAITTTELRAYVAKRLADGSPVRQKRGSGPRRNGLVPEVPRRPVSAGEINRELTVLKRMFSLAIQAGKLLHKPHFPMLRENNVRAGFFEREQYLSVLRHLPTSMRPVVTFAYVTGWRINSEVLPMQWRQVDMKAGEVRLDPGTTKNLEGRVFYLTSGTEGATEGPAKSRRPHSAPEGHDRPARVLPRRAHRSRRRRVLVRTCDLAQRVLPRLVPGPDRRRLSGEHSARLSPDGHPEHGPRRHSGARGDEVERPQDAQRVRSL